MTYIDGLPDCGIHLGYNQTNLGYNQTNIGGNSLNSPQELMECHIDQILSTFIFDPNSVETQQKISNDIRTYIGSYWPGYEVIDLVVTCSVPTDLQVQVMVSEPMNFNFTITAGVDELQVDDRISSGEGSLDVEIEQIEHDYKKNNESSRIVSDLTNDEILYGAIESNF